MARQESWAEVGSLLRGLDSSRDHATNGKSTAISFAKGARRDAVSAAIMAVGRQDEDAAIRALDPLDLIFEELCEDHGIAFIVAMAHIETAEAWHGAFDHRDTPPANPSAFKGHMTRARTILDRFDPIACNAPTLAMAGCRLLRSLGNPSACTADVFEDLIDLDPSSPMHLRHFGRALMPRWFGDHDQLDAEARRMAMLTRDVWGAGGYTWMYLDPLSCDPQSLDRIDADLFIEGLHDILDQCPDHSIRNLFAVLTGVTLDNAQDDDRKRQQIAQCFNWIVQDHLREICPVIWADAPGAPRHQSETDRIKFGQSRATQVLARHFSDSLSAGQFVSLTDNGLVIGSPPATWFNSRPV
ncbi:MAG: hypothetical protein MK160_08905 [Rhodobacteraceae bacterium]|nr:hypothetical protein [Paracoccaceae bacterium]